MGLYRGCFEVVVIGVMAVVGLVFYVGMVSSNISSSCSFFGLKVYFVNPVCI